MPSILLTSTVASTALAAPVVRIMRSSCRFSLSDRPPSEEPVGLDRSVESPEGGSGRPERGCAELRVSPRAAGRIARFAGLMAKPRAPGCRSTASGNARPSQVEQLAGVVWLAGNPTVKRKISMRLPMGLGQSSRPDNFPVWLVRTTMASWWAV